MEPAIAEIFQLDPSAECVGMNDPLPEVDRSSCVRVPPICTDTSVSVEDQERMCKPCSNLSIMADPDLVPFALGNVSGSPSHILVSSSSSSLHRIGGASASEIGKFFLSFVVVWLHFEERGFFP